jgi:hypothetical protein
MTTRTIRVVRRIATETGANFDDLYDAARVLLIQNPKLDDAALEKLLRNTKT